MDERHPGHESEAEGKQCGETKGCGHDAPLFELRNLHLRFNLPFSFVAAYLLFGWIERGFERDFGQVTSEGKSCW